MNIIKGYICWKMGAYNQPASEREFKEWNAAEIIYTQCAIKINRSTRKRER